MQGSRSGTGQIKLRKLDGYKQLAGVLNAQLRNAA